ncbi:MAG: DMT family transporter [Paracoccaceae bacterium]
MENLRGALFMTLAMAGFAIEDSLIKILATIAPTWQIVLFLGAGGTVLFGAMTLSSGRRLFQKEMLHPAVLLRNLGELVGVIGFVTALARSELSSASAILQASPLVVTLGAALFLGEPVGWRRWSAILVGFFGVMLIVRPGVHGFDANALYAVVGVIGLAIRDVATRRVPAELSSRQLGFLGMLTAIPAAAILSMFSPVGWAVLPGWGWVTVAFIVAIGGVAYITLIQATRIGEISFVTPFRYTRMVFALAAGLIVFGERPDALMLLGTAIIIGSGLYTFWRERIRATAA